MLPGPREIQQLQRVREGGRLRQGRGWTQDQERRHTVGQVSIVGEGQRRFWHAVVPDEVQVGLQVELHGGQRREQGGPPYAPERLG